jgi:hypothetical protein
LAELQDLVVPRVHAAGGEERDDVERVVRESGLDVRPTGAGVHALRFERDVDERRALGDDLSRAEGVVADLRSKNRTKSS